MVGAGDGRVFSPRRSSQETQDYGRTPTSSPVSQHSGYGGDEDASQREYNYSRLRSSSRLDAMQQPHLYQEVEDCGARGGSTPCEQEELGGGQAVVHEAWYRRSNGASNGAAGGGWQAITGSELEKKEAGAEEAESETEEEDSVTEEEEEPAIEEG